MFPTQGRLRTPWDGNCHTGNAQSLYQGWRRAHAVISLDVCNIITPGQGQVQFSCLRYRAHPGPNLSGSKVQPEDNVSPPLLRDPVASIQTWQVGVVKRFRQGKGRQVKTGSQGAERGARNHLGDSSTESMHQMMLLCATGSHLQSSRQWPRAS